MKLLSKYLPNKTRKPTTQDEVVKFVGDKKNIAKAAEGSMQKRIDVFQRAEAISNK